MARAGQGSGSGGRDRGFGSSAGVDLAQEGNRWLRGRRSRRCSPVVRGAAIGGGGALFDRAGLTWSVFRSFAEAVAQDPDLSPENPMFSRVQQPGVGLLPVPDRP